MIVKTAIKNVFAVCLYILYIFIIKKLNNPRKEIPAHE